MQELEETAYVYTESIDRSPNRSTSHYIHYKFTHIQHVHQMSILCEQTIHHDLTQ